ncbi:MAG: M1 family metallopeptidase [Deltaproteobacteria bacterium]|nr:MAG: M1 family metallopeptidase [Deltaproteobacteria bacterium]
MNEFEPINYKMHLEPDLVKFKFSGRVEIRLATTRLVDGIVLNALDLSVWSCKVKLNNGFVVCPFRVDPEKEEIHLSLPREMTGEITVQIDYEGLINNKMAGFYRSEYQTNGETKFIAITQFEESDARRAFPCLDHPAKKATFDIAMTIDENLVAISNGSVKADQSLGDGKKRVTFHQTPKMSTYLVFLGVGELDIIESPIDKRVRVAAVPDMAKYGQFGLEFGVKALKFCEEFYQIPYPLPKMDLIAIPDFAFGAMENWGAITFRENLLLHYPDITSRSGLEGICEVIAHEIAHQWFGNLVTPSDWQYLWLNESFATYFGYGVVDHYHPEWGVWEQFLNGQTAGALARDALHENFAIEIPGGEHVVINTSTAPIIYSKGGSILRQVQGYVGKDNFRNGLSRYLKRHAYANASSHHLWEALEEVSDKPVTEMMQSWIEQPGFPIVAVERKGKKLYLTQKRFTYLPNTSDQKWLIPIRVLIFDSKGGSKEMATLLDDTQVDINLGADVAAYKVNSGQTGFYRVKYNTPSDFEEIGKLVQKKQLSVEDRWGLQNDLYALLRCGQAPIDDYLDFLSNYQNEDAFLPLSSIADNLFQAHLILDDNQKKKIAVIGKALLETTLETMGYNPTPEESHTTSILRDQIIFQAVAYGSERTAEFAADKFNSLFRGDNLHPDIQKSIYQVGALTAGANAYEWLVERLQSSQSEHERMNILTALGCFNDKDLIHRALQYVLDQVPPRNKFIPIVAMAANPYAVDYLWDWYVSHLTELEQFHPMLYERVIAAIVPMSGMKRKEEVSEFFSQYLDQNPKPRDIVKLSLEKLEINLRMRSS